MEKPEPECKIPVSGTFVYRDSYDIIYRVDWETSNSGFDITTTIQDPRVPGQQSQGYKQGYALFRRGCITIERQILVGLIDGYEILSAGGTQEVAFFQSSFPNGPQPTDLFCYHLDNMVVDEIRSIISFGPCWTDPDNQTSDNTVWDDIGVEGTDISPGTPSAQLFNFISSDLISNSTSGLLFWDQEPHGGYVLVNTTDEYSNILTVPFAALFVVGNYVYVIDTTTNATVSGQITSVSLSGTQYNLFLTTYSQAGIFNDGDSMSLSVVPPGGLTPQPTIEQSFSFIDIWG